MQVLFLNLWQASIAWDLLVIGTGSLALLSLAVGCWFVSCVFPASYDRIHVNASCLERVHISLLAFPDDCLHGRLKLGSRILCSSCFGK